MFFFRLVKSNSSMITLITEFKHTFQYVAMFSKMTFSKINLLNKVLLIVVLAFLNIKTGKAFHCSIISSEEFLKINYLKS